MQARNLGNDGESQPESVARCRARGVGLEERFQNACPEVGRNARPIVIHRDLKGSRCFGQPHDHRVGELDRVVA